MKKKEIQKIYEEKVRLINKFNKFYYDKNDPKISDKDYDQIKEEILKLEKKYNFLNSDKSPSKTVGYTPSKIFKKVLHRAPMLSLSNAFSESDLENFEKKILNFLSKGKNFRLSYRA